jgi:hypothetical protein
MATDIAHIPANVRVLWRQNAAAVLLFPFRSKRLLTPRPDRLFEEQRKPSGVCLAFGHSWCDKRVIGESPNLIHNVAPNRAEIGRLSADIGSFLVTFSICYPATP